jgi:hypothetical protein
MNAVLVTPKCYLQSGGGGVQWCTREYVKSLIEAGTVLQIVSTESPRNLSSRLQRRLFPTPYKGLHQGGVVSEVLKAVDATMARWVFLNNSESASLAPALRAMRPDIRLCFLSHGVEIMDVVNNLRLAPQFTSHVHQRSRWIGDLIKTEIRIREALDTVICISEPDVAFEYWLGSARVQFLPRSVSSEPLPWLPVKGCVGTVGTLNHGPNLHGLCLFAEAVEGFGRLELRVVGGPRHIGLELERRYECIRYLGELADDALRDEAKAWRAFINPIFCHARGASTKVATALGWGIPVATTIHGARGYCWDEESLPLAATVAELADIARAIANCENPQDWRERTRRIARMAPTPQDTGQKLLNFLNGSSAIRVV